MANFQTRFDAAEAEARRLVVEHGGAIRDVLPRFWGSDFQRLTGAISRLLERVDKNQVDHAEYLAHSTGNIAEHAIQLIQGVPASVESGALHFVQTTLPGLLLCEERLAKAVGSYYYKVKDVKDKQVREIQKLAEEALTFRQGVLDARKETTDILAEATKIVENLRRVNGEAVASASKVTETRDAVVKLASGDGRGKSLEALKRVAESKLEAIETVLKKASTASDRAEVASKNLESRTSDAQSLIEQSTSSADEVLKEIEEIKAQAEAVLSLSNQAGLARSYLKESEKLALRSYIYTGILYATSIAAAAIAAFYVLPSLEHSVATNTASLADRALPIALLRATVLAPLVYVIYFTTRQISSLETLRMDYAEKAAASLAYSGYKDEMSDDTTLLDRLRGSLLLKFAEHPERLLRKRPTNDSIQVEGPGFKATSTSAGAPPARPEKSADDDDE